MTVETVTFDPTRYFNSDDAQHALIRDALASGNAGYIADAIGIVAKKRGMTAIAEQIGMSRSTLYTTLSANGNPTLETLIKVLGALGLQLDVREPEAA